MSHFAASPEPSWDVVIPTVGRPQLHNMLEAFLGGDGPMPGCVYVVDDRRDTSGSLFPDGEPSDLIKVLPGRAAGPAAARNIGWRASSAEWIAFLDDDVLTTSMWRRDFEADLQVLDDEVAATQGRLTVPLPDDRAATDWERNVAGLEGAVWATADMAYRRAALLAVGGFDERFPRAYREDADLGLRVLEGGWTIAKGKRVTAHPVRPANRWISIKLQKGNADDVLMRALHGRDWRSRAHVPPGRRPHHIATTVTGVVGVAAALAGRRSSAALAGAAWLAQTADFAWRRIKPGPRTVDEILTMAITSAVVPPAAVWHWLKGHRNLRNNLLRSRTGAKPAAVLFDRDGTLVVDVPYNGDPDKVELMPGATLALTRVREAGIPTAVITNQSGVARGLIRIDDVDAVNAKVEQLLGPVGPFLCCVHGANDGCSCRKPEPGMVYEAAAQLGVKPSEIVVIGDIAADIEAAHEAGARGILVPTSVTRPEEVERAPEVASSIVEAVTWALEGRR